MLKQLPFEPKATQHSNVYHIIFTPSIKAVRYHKSSTEFAEYLTLAFPLNNKTSFARQ